MFIIDKIFIFWILIKDAEIRKDRCIWQYQLLNVPLFSGKPKNEALEVSFWQKLVLSSIEVVRGHLRSKIAKKGQISIFYKSRLIIPKNEALEVSFWQVSLKLIWGRLRSPEVNNCEKRSNFNLLQKKANFTTKWSLWAKFFTNGSLKVIRGHPRSKIAKMVEFQSFSKLCAKNVMQ